MVEKIIKKLDLNQTILACAACGLAQAEEMEGAKHRKIAVTALTILELTDVKRAKYYGLDTNMRQAWGVYPQISTPLPPVSLYHLHPQFVVRLTI